MKGGALFNRLLLVAVLTFAVPVQAALIVFGDSLSDAGNVLNESIALGLNPDPPSPPYFQGRMSNGPNWADLVSQHYGLGLTTASSLGGNNYAWAGSTSGTGTTLRPSIVYPGQVQPVDNAGKQIQTYASSHPGGFASNDLVLYWSGANDIFYDTIGSVPVATAVANLITLTRTNLLTLESLGATRIVVPNQIDAAKAPIWNGSFGLPAAAQPYITAVTTLFDAQLPGLLASLESMPGFDADLIPVDMYSVAASVIAHPAAFGFTNVTDPAFPGNIPSAGTYLFWDPIHPTTAADRLLADAAIRAIPEPGVVSLIGIALILVAYFGIRPRRAPTGHRAEGVGPA